jgi:hypothetical protein
LGRCGWPTWRLRSDPWQRYRERRIRERHEAAEPEEALRRAAEDYEEAATLSADTREEGFL